MIPHSKFINVASSDSISWSSNASFSIYYAMVATWESIEITGYQKVFGVFLSGFNGISTVPHIYLNGSGIGLIFDKEPSFSALSLLVVYMED